MSTRIRQIRKWAIRGVLLLIVAGIAAPFIHADGFQDRIQAALSDALHRPVKIDRVRFSLFNGPGFVVEKVLIEEDPSIGIEPFAYVQSLDARINLISLWKRHLEFSSLTLDDPSVNLAKPDAQPWNVVALVANVMGGGASGTPAATNSDDIHLPTIKIRGGRIDFKFGDTKSNFYITNANVDITPRDAGSFDLDFEGEPARTDRTSHGFGTFRAQGRYTHRASHEPTLDFAVQLERSAIDDLARGFAARTFGLHGSLASRATIKGPLSNLEIVGQMELADVHRWDFIPTGNTGPLRWNYRGTLNWPAQMLDISTPASDNPSIPFTARVRASNLLSQPRWATELAVEKLSAENVVNACRHMGLPVPGEFTLDGNVSGVLGHSSLAGLQGKVMLAEGAVRFSPHSRLDLRETEILFNGDQIVVSPVLVSGDEGQTAELSAEYSIGRHALHVELHGRALRIAELQTTSGNILSSAAVPFVENFSRGKWTGSLEYNLLEGAPGRWSGGFDLRDARVQVPGLAEPLTVSSASVQMDGNRVSVSNMRAHTASIEFTGEYRYEPEAPNPHRFNFVVPTLDLGAAEELLLPTLRREQGFLARTLRRPVRLPDWLVHRQAEGTIRVGTLNAAALELRDVKAHVVWDATDIEITNLAGRLEDGKSTAQATINLAGAQPVYHVRARVQDLTWRGGKVDFDTKIASRGIGPDFLLNLKSDGAFDARSLVFSPDAPLRTATGSYEFSVSAIGPRLKLTDVQAAVGAERFTGQGATQADGKVQIELASNTRVLRATGALVPLRLDVTVARQ